MGPADCRKRLENPVWFSPAPFQRGCPQTSGPQAGSSNGTRSRHSFEKGGHKTCSSSSLKSFWVLLHHLEKGWGVVSDHRSVSVELRYQIFRGMVCHDRSQGRILNLPQHRKFLSFAFGGKAYQYRVLPFGLSLSPRNFLKCVDAALTPQRLQGIRILNYINDDTILAI